MNRENEYRDLDDEAFLDDPEAELPEDEEISDEDIELEEASALKAENRELKDRLLRALADVENIRKRADRDKRDAELYASTRFARDMLNVYDNFDRAMQSCTDETRASAPGLIEGIELTQKDLVSAFEKHKIVKIEPQNGERFDPKLHQAMFEAPVPGSKSGDIIQVMSVGFTIGERLLRPAQVGVSSGGPAVPQEPEPSDSK
ncbi:nucleotide exchange factor GrpE [Amaricoccus tamworthensis]|uniref:nucleotide exchange factor GrpE n=1 Tax=Amaricoccus tamworthensis TaxID=57002 RepID=UPI003C798C2F